MSDENTADTPADATQTEALPTPPVEPTTESPAEPPADVTAEPAHAEVAETPAEVTAAEPEVAPVAAEDETAKPAKKAKPKKAKSEAEEPVEEEPPVPEVPPADIEAEAAVAPPPENKKKWYAVKVQSGREDTIKAAILRKVAIEGLEEFFGEIAIPYEEKIEKKLVRVLNKKTDEYEYQEKKVKKKIKKFQGYIFANVEFNDRILYLFRETSGVGDFLNVRGTPGNPIAEPMPEHEVKAMLTGEKVKDPNKPVKIKLDFEKGDKVRIRDGSFANSEGEVKAIIEAKDPSEAPKVTVVLTFWGRPLDVELEANQVEKL
jgi:transcriptional antiterminator NusG